MDTKKLIILAAAAGVAYWLLKRGGGQSYLVDTADGEAGSLIGGFLTASETVQSVFLSDESLNMNFSIQLLDYLKSWEKFSAKPYYATAAEKAEGILTIGYGHVIVDGDGLNENSVLTEIEATGLLLNDVAKYQTAVNRGVKVPLTQNQFDALVSFTFNVGTGAFKNSTLRKKLNAGDYDAVPVQLMKWVKQGGATLQGLVARRGSEVRIWEDSDYSR